MLGGLHKFCSLSWSHFTDEKTGPRALLRTVTDVSCRGISSAAQAPLAIPPFHPHKQSHGSPFSLMSKSK